MNIGDWVKYRWGKGNIAISRITGVFVDTLDTSEMQYKYTIESNNCVYSEDELEYVELRFQKGDYARTREGKVIKIDDIKWYKEGLWYYDSESIDGWYREEELSEPTEIKEKLKEGQHIILNRFSNHEGIKVEITIIDKDYIEVLYKSEDEETHYRLWFIDYKTFDTIEKKIYTVKLEGDFIWEHMLAYRNLHADYDSVVSYCWNMAREYAKNCMSDEDIKSVTLRENGDGLPLVRVGSVLGLFCVKEVRE